VNDLLAWPDVLLLVGAATPIVALAGVGLWALISLPRRLQRARARLAAETIATPLISLDDVEWDWPVLLRGAAGTAIPAAPDVNPIEGRASTCLLAPPESYGTNLP
jgi:hypothetical protein